MDLEEIAQIEKFVLFDTSINVLHQFLWNIFTKKNYSQINYKDIIYAQERLLSLLNFVNFKNTFTIKEVVEELSNLKEILSKKARDINRRNKRIKKKKEDYGNQEEYNKLLEITNQVIKKINKNIVNIKENGIYNILYNSILDINEKFCLTYNSNVYDNQLNKQPKIFQKENNLHTDEHLVATLFYLSIIGKSYALVTRDAGIFMLANKLNMLIYADESSSCKCLRDILIETPTKIYIPYPLESIDYILRFSSNENYLNHEIEKQKKELKELKKKGFQVIKF